MSHRGSLLIVPSGVYGWDVAAFDELTPERCRGSSPSSPAPPSCCWAPAQSTACRPRRSRKLFAEAGIGLEPMSTGAAARTYNVLLAEGRDLAPG